MPSATRIPWRYWTATQRAAHGRESTRIKNKKGMISVLLRRRCLPVPQWIGVRDGRLWFASPQHEDAHAGPHDRLARWFIANQGLVGPMVRIADVVIRPMGGGRPRGPKKTPSERARKRASSVTAPAGMA